MSGELGIEVASLSLEGVTDAHYTLSVHNGSNRTGDLVWERDVDSSKFGDGAGSLSYVGPCDAATGVNSVTIELHDLYEGNGQLIPESTYEDPTPISRDFMCVENADVFVVFEMTIMRDARQGFFDIAVNFDDIYCSAKVDCGDIGDPLTLVFDPDTGTRVPTVVAALACTDGDPSDSVATHLYRNDLTIRCGGDTYAVSASAGPGNLYASSAEAPAPLVQAMVFEGVESLTNGGADADKLYWNVALGLDVAFFEALPGTTTCTLETLMTASAGPLANGEIPALSTYPYINVTVPLYTGDVQVCSHHPLNGIAPNDGVATAYSALPGGSGVPGLAFDHLMAPSGPGIATGSVVPEHWSTPLVPTLTEARGAVGVNVGAGFSFAGMIGEQILWSDYTNLLSMDETGLITNHGASATTTSGNAITSFSKVWGDRSGVRVFASVDLTIASVASRGLVSSTDGTTWTEVRVNPTSSNLYIEYVPCGEYGLVREYGGGAHKLFGDDGATLFLDTAALGYSSMLVDPGCGGSAGGTAVLSTNTPEGKVLLSSGGDAAVEVVPSIDFKPPNGIRGGVAAGDAFTLAVIEGTDGNSALVSWDPMNGFKRIAVNARLQPNTFMDRYYIFSNGFARPAYYDLAGVRAELAAGADPTPPSGVTVPNEVGGSVTNTRLLGKFGDRTLVRFQHSSDAWNYKFGLIELK